MCKQYGHQRHHGYLYNGFQHYILLCRHFSSPYVLICQAIFSSLLGVFSRGFVGCLGYVFFG